MQPLAPRRLNEWMITETFEMLFELQREGGHVRKLETLRWIEIVTDVIRLGEMRSARMHLMQFNARQVRQPDQRRFLGSDGIILLLFAKRHVLKPVRRPIWPILLVERFPADAVWI